jgi:hypothetical protein
MAKTAASPEEDFMYGHTHDHWVASKVEELVFVVECLASFNLGNQ